MQIRIEPPGTLIFDDGDILYEMGRKTIELYFDLKSQNRIVTVMSEANRGEFVYLDVNGMPQVFTPLAINKAILTKARKRKKDECW